MAALLVGVRIDLRGSPAGAESTAIGEPPVALPRADEAPTGTTPREAPSRSKPTRTPATHPPASEGPRRFVWAPVRGASGYHVEFFRGTTLVFAADTRVPEIPIPPSWTFAGTRQSLGPGAYRWYVWTETSGRRSSQAIVQAKLVVPAG